MDLIKTFTPEQFEQGLESWAWIGLEGKTPLFASPFGDIFLRGEDGFWWLDTIEGALLKPWETAEEMQAELRSPGGQDRYLLGGLAWAAEEEGVVPTGDQVYAFTVPPILGGDMGLENVQVVDFVVAANVAGQLHEQVRDLPEGTAVSEVTIA
ncbi:T6SS immunity protein Tdi1 domain-containing protein [Intrasporangium oryzae]|uniref:T6SS immunity protein Tdi1 domain-containing protein n=1 Tax=Intrasporangium oryzae TaxID=412687 RepID=UPI0004AD5F3B|nr:T6SS immunity protein Tdi1 domain-containing protein [Intrasporangium oryzae]